MFLFLAIFLQFVSSDIFSVNSGGNTGLIINPDKYFEGFFFGENEIPVMSNVILYSVPYETNTTHENLTVSYSSSDEDGDALTNISDWRVNGVSMAVLNMPFDTYINTTATGAIRDYSTYGNNGTLGGGNVSRMPVWNSSCQVGGCYTFDGVSDYIQLPEPPASSTNIYNGSVFAWIKTSDAGSGWRGIVVKQLAYGIFLEGNTLSIYDWGTSTQRDTNINLADNTWHLVGVTFQSGIASGTKIYIDGVLNLTTSITVNNQTEGVVIASGYNPGTLQFFKGSIDEVKIYNRTLTPEQIRADYQAGLAGHSIETIVSQETNVGEIWQVAMTANDALSDSITVLSNNLTIVNTAPNDPNPLLVSVNGRNESDADLNCSFDVLDADSYYLNITVNWLKDNVSQINITYINIANGTYYSSILDSNNLTLGDIWKCSVRYYDGYAYSNWIDSNELEIIDITPPNITIISPQPINYTDLNVTFNVSIIENENVSMCFYSLDGAENISMIEVNDSYFWILDETFGPGEHNVTFYCNDTSNNWGTNSTNFTIENEAAIAILLSDELSWSVKWNVMNLPVDDLDAEGNNLNNATDYYINVSAINTLVDVYVKADGDLYTLDLDVLPLENENYTVSLSDPNVTGVSKVTMTTDYVLIADGIGDDSVIYLKFYLDAPPSQAAGTYLNNLNFKAVRHGQSI